MTFYELTQGGDLAHTTGEQHPLSFHYLGRSSQGKEIDRLRFHSTEFYNLPHPLLMRSLQALSKQGKAQVFRGTSAAGSGVGDEGDGVKFL